MADVPTGSPFTRTRDAVVRMPAGLFSPHLRIGVTGLAGAGKTSFLISLINQFENLQGENWQQRSGLSRLVAARWDESAVERPFAYRAGIERLTSDPPQWPQPTRELSQARIELRARRSGWLGRLRGDFEGQVDLIDYPGEWLLDLVLLQWDFARFSREMLAVLSAPEAPPQAREVFAMLRSLDGDAPWDEALHHQHVAAYRQGLRALRDAPNHRRFLFPGRLLMSINDAAIEDDGVWFLPLPDPDSSETRLADTDSLRAEYRRRYDAYVRRVARTFYDDVFKRLDMQVILVDVLGALRGGREALLDVRRAFAALTRVFRYGDGHGFWSRLFPQVGQVVIAVTQVDEILPEDQGNAVRAIEDLLFDEIQSLRQRGVRVTLRAVSALRCTRPVSSESGPALEGFRRDDHARIRFVPPRLPAHLPGDLNIRVEALPELSPPFGLRRVGGFPNFRMVEVLEDLVGHWLEEKT